MRKSIFISILLLLFTTSVYSESIWEKYDLTSLKTQQRPLGTITALDGDMRIQKIGRNEIEDARVGDVIHRGDIVTQYVGTSTVTLRTGSTANLTGEAKMLVDNDGFHMEHGVADFSSKNQAEKFDAGHSDIVSRNSDMKISRGKDGLLNKYFAEPDKVDVSKGAVSIRVPDGIDQFDIFYEDSEELVSADRFVLRADETALFDGKDVTIVKKNAIKPPLERDDRFRHYIGAEISAAYLSRTMENADKSSEQLIVARPGFTYALLQRRVDPMFMFTYTTDPEMDEFKLEYIHPRSDLFAEGLFKSTPYYKLSVGLGNTHSRDFTPTHSSYGVGYGWLKKINQFSILEDFLLFTDLNIKRRDWEFDRGGDAAVRDQTWEETEFSIETKFLYRFRW